MDDETEKSNLDAQYKNWSEFAVFEEFNEKNQDQKVKIKSWVKKLNMGNRQKTQIDPNLVKQITIDDESYDNDDDESDPDIFYIDEKGRETNIKSKEQHKTIDVCADGKDENLPNGTGSSVQAAPDADYFGLPNAVVSKREAEMWAIPTRNRKIELDVVWRCTSPVPPKLTKKAKKQVKNTRKESAERIRPIKESKQSKNMDKTVAKTDKIKMKDKGQQKLNVESSDSDADNEVPYGSEVRTLANVRVIAIEGYTAQNRDELTFKAAQTIKQKMPANSDGMAYGWIRKRKLKRKTYGYYPANLVEIKPKKEKTGILGRLSKKAGILRIAS